MQQAPNPEFYLCPTCNNQIRSQNRLLHEARCEFLRKTSPSQAQIQQVPINSYPTHQQVIANYNRNPQNNNPPSQPPFRQPLPNPLPYNSNANFNSNRPPPSNPFFENPNRTPSQNNNTNSNNERGVCHFCNKQFPMAELEEHEMACPFTNERCRHCSYEFPRTFLSTHINSCPMLTSLCPECNEDFPLEILQEHINAEHLPAAPLPASENDKRKREASPSFFDKMKNFFSSNDKKEKPKTTKCTRCKNKILLSVYEKHIRECQRPPPPPQRPPGNNLFSLMFNSENGGQNRVLFRQPSGGPRGNINEMDIEARKMRELMLLMHLLLAQRPKEDPGLKEQEIEDHSYVCKYDVDKNQSLIEDYKKCSICQCDFEQDEQVRILVCLHRYHKECADAWLKKKSWCPLCRRNVRNGEEEIKEDEDNN